MCQSATRQRIETLRLRYSVHGDPVLGAARRPTATTDLIEMADCLERSKDKCYLQCAAAGFRVFQHTDGKLFFQHRCEHVSDGRVNASCAIVEHFLLKKTASQSLSWNATFEVMVQEACESIERKAFLGAQHASTISHAIFLLECRTLHTACPSHTRRMLPARPKYFLCR